MGKKLKKSKWKMAKRRWEKARSFFSEKSQTGPLYINQSWLWYLHIWCRGEICTQDLSSLPLIYE